MKPEIFICKSDVLLTCCLESTHGVSGHLFEILELLKFLLDEGVDAQALIPFSFTKQELMTSLDRYNWCPELKLKILEHVSIIENVKILKCNHVIFVDGIISYHPKAVTVVASKITLIRCARECNFERADIVLQDSRLYNDLPNSAHYVKKVLCQDFKPCKSPDIKTALVYATRACRELPQTTIQEIKDLCYPRVLVLSEEPYTLPEGFVNMKVPVQDMFSLFTDFLYTPVGGYCDPFDCSPRLPVECFFLNKGFRLLAPLYRGLDVRLYDLERDPESLLLKSGDKILDFL